ncbi:unnamed protein product [Psylliodes chrysocephalus]|uniref:Uncharacterized protein n=1 Tax=Psylliodes chrysocephalus TaxID=3402493 RepID=A0A9P0CUM0_9CUCU|nr:unnamed protein product [Psylliodes chrysocephala]
MPKSNFGNTNDGNTSRRFFENLTLAAEITGISYELIYRLKAILEAISSRFEINPVNYERYASETARLYVKLYDWHPMTPTMYKILVYGAVIIEKALLPIGQLSEEAAEARNKHFRSYRQDFARKFSRESFAQNKFLLNDRNKVRLIDMLKVHLEKNKTLTLQADEDADRLIVTTAISISSSYEVVKIVGEDIDLLVLLCELSRDGGDHILLTNRPNNIIFVKCGREKPRCHLLDKFLYVTGISLLFHAFRGCDTTSAPFGQEKKNSIDNKKKQSRPEQNAGVFLSSNATPEQVAD